MQRVKNNYTISSTCIFVRRFGPRSGGPLMPDLDPNCFRHSDSIHEKLNLKKKISRQKHEKLPCRVKPQLHCHDFGHDGATTHPDLSSRDASA